MPKGSGKKDRDRAEELVFLPLGGVGEIGMNLGLYGFGPPDDRTWIAVDFGIAFADADTPGAEVVFPDIGYLEEERINLAGILITHAHEDHYGALIDLWPRLRVPVYATPFAAGLLEAKKATEFGGEEVPVTVVQPGQPFDVGPFTVEYVRVTHSIPEANALAIRSPLGTVLHTGDWKIDPTPVLGEPTDRDRLTALGDEGVLATICDSTNAYREGDSPSESEVARELTDIVAQARGRVGFTTFSSNVGRLRSIAIAAEKAGREVVVVGRAIHRVLDVARELGMLDGLPPFRDEQAFEQLPRDKVVALLTGSQGEPRAALSRIVAGQHRRVSFDRGDTVVFSSRTIPGNEAAVNKTINALVDTGVRVITDRDRLVHVSGHPRRGELRQLYGWVRPPLSVPVHGEAMHLAAHEELLRDLGIPSLRIRNGLMARLAPGPADIVDEVGVGRHFRDGRLIGDVDALGITERRKLSFAGLVAVSVTLDRKGAVISEPDVTLFGVPFEDDGGDSLKDIAADAALGALDSIPRPRRRDPELVREALRRAVRSAVNEVWGKKPVCTVFVTVVGDR